MKQMASNFTHIFVIPSTSNRRTFLVFFMDKNHVLMLAVHEKWDKTLNAWEIPLVARGLSERTIETRIRHLRQFSREIRLLPEEIELTHLLIWAASKNWTPETRHAYYTSIRLFFRWYSETYATSNPAKALPSVRRPQTMPRPTPENVFLTAIQTADELTQLILFLGACSGLRAKEISEVHGQNIVNDLQGYSLIIKGKGGRERQVPLPMWLAHLLIRTCAYNGGYAFPGQINGHMSSAHISKLANSILETPWTLHTLRHRFATLAYSAERDLLTVQKLLGHASVSTTQRYAKPPENSLRKAITAADYRNAY